MTSVKKQVRYNGGGFDEHPEHINRKGRPDAGFTWREQFMKIAQEKKDRLHRIELAARRMWDEMEVHGNVKAFEKIADRMEGKALERLDHTTGGDKLSGFVVELVRETKNQDSGSVREDL